MLFLFAFSIRDLPWRLERNGSEIHPLYRKCTDLTSIEIDTRQGHRRGGPFYWSIGSLHSALHYAAPILAPCFPLPLATARETPEMHHSTAARFSIEPERIRVYRNKRVHTHTHTPTASVINKKGTISHHSTIAIIIIFITHQSIHTRSHHTNSNRSTPNSTRGARNGGEGQRVRARVCVCTLMGVHNGGAYT